MNPKRLPNIVLFNPDQWRGDILGHLGNPAVFTPNLDALVKNEAVSFSSAFCQSPVCTPSRCSLMSGWYPHVRGHRTMFHMMQPDEPVLLRDLKRAGYFVWWGGKNDLIPSQYGFDDYCNVKYQAEETPGRPLTKNIHTWQDWRGDPQGDNYYSFYIGQLEKPTGADYRYDQDAAMVEGAIQLIKNPPVNQPICIYLPLGSPHPPFGVEEPWFSLIDRRKLPPRIPIPVTWENKPSILQGIWQKQRLQNWSENRWRELLATYYGMCARVDALFGLLVKALQDTEQYDNTAIFFYSDHGEFAGNYGLVEKTQNTFEDCLTRVPFIIKPSQNIPCQAGIRESLVELVDLRATVEGVAGLINGYTHFGKSLLPTLTGQTIQHRQAVFCEGGRLHGEIHAMELQSSDNLVPEGLYWPRLSLQASEGPEHTKAVMCRTARYKYVRRLYETDELYDLLEDPYELNNLINNPSLNSVEAEMKEHLLNFFLETGDVVPFKADSRW